MRKVLREKPKQERALERAAAGLRSEEHGCELTPTPPFSPRNEGAGKVKERERKRDKREGEERQEEREREKRGKDIERDTERTRGSSAEVCPELRL